MTTQATDDGSVELFDIDSFRSRMSEANNRLISRFRHALLELYPNPRPTAGTDGSHPHDKRLDIFARFIWNYRGGIAHWPYELMDAPRSITDFAQLPESLEGILDRNETDGVLLPPKNTDDRELYLRLLEDAVNSSAENSQENVLLPVEYSQFLQACDGVFDIDLRREGVCEVQGIGPDVDLDEDEIVDSIPALDDMDLVEGRIVKAGWTLGIDSDAVCYWVLGRDVDDVQEHWTWQIVYFQNNSGDLHTFDSLREFLDWYASWDHRIIDMDRLLGKLLNFYDM